MMVRIGKHIANLQIRDEVSYIKKGINFFSRKKQGSMRVDIDRLILFQCVQNFDLANNTVHHFLLYGNYRK